MPLYEYLCQDCDSQIELLVRSTDEQPECPSCGSGKLMRLLSVPSAHTSGGDSAGQDSPGGGHGPCGSGCGCFPGG